MVAAATVNIIMDKISYPLLLALVLVIPIVTGANGGDQRVVENTYLINLSRAPFTPRAGDSVEMLASFVDLKTNKLVSEDMIVKIRVSRTGGWDDKAEFVYKGEEVNVIGGVLEFSYTFQDAGLHEIFFDFALVSSPEKIYEAPHFLLDIQRPEAPAKNNTSILVAVVATFIGGAAGWFIGRRKSV